jgi:2,3-dimethylmalate lyase
MSIFSSATEKRRNLAGRIKSREFVTAPGVYDMISTRIADSQDHPALYMTGYGVVASHLGVPDAGIASFRDMVGRARTICEGSRTPVIADADTGYGGLLNVRETVRGYEAAGVAVIQIEDQIFPKKCGHTPGREVITADEMVKKIKVAVEAREDPNFLIMARTDAREACGIEEAISRGRQYHDAGADIIFVESPESEAEFAEIGKNIDAPLLANMVEHGRSPILPTEKLKTLGFCIAIYPGTAMAAAAAALKSSYEHIKKTGSTIGSPTPLLPIPALHELMGFEDVWAFDKRWSDKS